jgi:CelD/BcsL family acetyltransferase involved in cellulose biosynthesis
MGTVAPQLRTEVIEQPERVAGLRSEWRRLFRQSVVRTPFQSPEWLLPWIEIFGPASLRVIAVWERDRLVGLAPLLIYPRGSERILAFAGGGVSDYLDLVVEPGKEAAVHRAIVSAVLQDRNWTRLELTDLPPHSVLFRSLKLRPKTLTHDTSSVLELPSNPSELLAKFSKRQRANLRNARSRLERAGGGSIERANADTLPEFLDDLFRLHTLRWRERGEPGVLHDEPLRAFHRMAAPKLLELGMLRIYRLRVEADSAAVSYALVDGETVYCYLQGFNPRFAFVSPGTLLMYSVIEDAVCSGMHNFDFLRGQEAYKQHWRAESRPTYCLALDRSTVTGLNSWNLQEVA